MDSLVEAQVRRCNSNLLFATLLVVVIVGALAYGESNYLYNFFLGPFQFDVHGLEANVVPTPGAKGNFFRLKPTKVFDTGFQDVNQKIDNSTNVVKDETVLAEYIAARVENRLLLVKVSKGGRRDFFEGELQPLTPELSDSLVTPLVSQDERFRGVILPVLLDATGYRSSGYFGLAVGLGLILLSARNVRKYLTRSGDMWQHPAVRRLKRFGDPATVVTLLDNEASLNPIVKFKTLRILPNWLLSIRPFGFDFVHMPELVWAYKKVTRHYHYFIIPTGKTHCLLVYDSRGTALEVLNGATEKAIDSVMTEIHDKAPWAILGYSAELKRIWSKNPAEFAAVVAERKASMAPAR